jgi:hypothetical protein
MLFMMAQESKIALIYYKTGDCLFCVVRAERLRRDKEGRLS